MLPAVADEDDAHEELASEREKFTASTGCSGPDSPCDAQNLEPASPDACSSASPLAFASCSILERCGFSSPSRASTPKSKSSTPSSLSSQCFMRNNATANEELEDLNPRELYEAYDKWLHDIHKPPRGAKRKKKKRHSLLSIGIVHGASNHLQQHTLSSSNKLSKPYHPVAPSYIATSTSLPTLKRGSSPPTMEEKMLYQQQQNLKRFEQLAEEVNFQHYSYPPKASGIDIHDDPHRGATASAGSPQRLPATICPGSNFFFALANALTRTDVGSLGHTKIKLQSPVNVPPTLVSSARAQVFCISARAQHHLHVHFFRSFHDFVAKSGHLFGLTEQDVDESDEQHQRLLPCPILAFLKRSANAECRRNMLFAIRDRQQLENAIQQLWQPETSSGADGFRAVQRFVKCKSRSLSWIVRVHWAKRDQSTMSSIGPGLGILPLDAMQSGKAADWTGTTNVWILSDSNNEFTSTSVSSSPNAKSGGTGSAASPKTPQTRRSVDLKAEEDPFTSLREAHGVVVELPTCQIIRSANNQSWREPRAVVEQLVQQFEQVMKVTFDDLVCDLLQDVTGLWHLLQVKACQCFQRKTSGSPRGLPNEPMSALPSAASREEEIKAKCGGKYCKQTQASSGVETLGGLARGSLMPAPEEFPAGFMAFKDILSCHFVENVMLHGYAKSAEDSNVSTFTSALDSFFLTVRKRDKNRFYDRLPLCAHCFIQYTKLKDRMQVMQDSESKTKPVVRKSARRKVGGHRQILGRLSPLKSLPQSLPAHHDQQQPRHHGASVQEPQGLQGQLVHPKKDYLKEMEEIERILQESDARVGRDATSTGSKNQSLDTPTTSSSPQKSPGKSKSSSEPLTKNANAANFSNSFLERMASHKQRVEEMWKTVDLRPITSSTCSSSVDAFNSVGYGTGDLVCSSNVGGSDKPSNQQGYNSFALDSTSSNRSSKTSSAACDANVTLVPIVDAAQVFYDESFRERIVQDTQQLLDQDPAHVIRLVAYPQKQSVTSVDMMDSALRTLFLDISHQNKEFGVMPRILVEASGCHVLEIRRQ